MQAAKEAGSIVAQTKHRPHLKANEKAGLAARVARVAGETGTIYNVSCSSAPRLAAISTQNQTWISSWLSVWGTGPTGNTGARSLT